MPRDYRDRELAGEHDIEDRQHFDRERGAQYGNVHPHPSASYSQQLMQQHSQSPVSLYEDSEDAYMMVRVDQIEQKYLLLVCKHTT